MPENVGVAIQFLTRSALPKWRSWGQSAVNKASQGMKLSQAISEARGHKIGLFKDIGKAVFAKKEEEKKEYKASQMEQEAMKKIEEKSAKPGLECNLRIIVSTSNQSVSKLAIENVLNSFNQFNIYQFGNALGRAGSKKDKIIKNFIYRVLIGGVTTQTIRSFGGKDDCLAVL